VQKETLSSLVRKWLIPGELECDPERVYSTAAITTAICATKVANFPASKTQKAGSLATPALGDILIVVD
jgi:hypothetical protein